MEELDQGYLHLLQEIARQTCPGRSLNPQPPALQASPLAKSHLDSLLITIRHIYMRPPDGSPVGYNEFDFF